MFKLSDVRPVKFGEILDLILKDTCLLIDSSLRILIFADLRGLAWGVVKLANKTRPRSRTIEFRERFDVWCV
jgi:hypothetical protein